MCLHTHCKCIEETAQITIMSKLSYFPCFLSVHGWQLDRDCKNLPSVICNNKGADQPAHPRSLISNVVVCFLDESYLHLLREKFQFLASLFSRIDWFKTRFVGNPEDRFSRVVACLTALGHILQVQQIIILKINNEEAVHQIY